MSVYKYVRELYKNPKKNLGQVWKDRIVLWRREPATVRCEHPTRIDRARSLGFKAKQGIFVVRQRVERGGRMRPKINKARRSKTKRQLKIVNMNYQWVAEQRAAKKYPNCEVLNSYWVMEDGKYVWYEIIIVDRDNPSILADKNLKWVHEHKNRVLHGLTSAGKRSRGILTNKGKGAEKLRP